MFYKITNYEGKETNEIHKKKKNKMLTKFRLFVIYVTLSRKPIFLGYLCIRNQKGKAKLHSFLGKSFDGYSGGMAALPRNVYRRASSCMTYVNCMVFCSNCVIHQLR